MDDGSLVVESWLKSATEYIAINNIPLRPGINNIPLRPGIRVDGRSALARHDESAGQTKISNMFC